MATLETENHNGELASDLFHFGQKEARDLREIITAGNTSSDERGYHKGKSYHDCLPCRMWPRRIRFGYHRHGDARIQPAKFACRPPHLPLVFNIFD